MGRSPVDFIAVTLTIGMDLIVDFRIFILLYWRFFMKYLFLIVFLLFIFKLLLSGIGNLFYSILTLSFLPNGLGIFDGEVTTYFIPIVGYIINCIVVAFINILDFIIWFIYWIPGVHTIIDLVHRAPDIDQLESFKLIFGQHHRNFITHSVLNPIFLLFLVLTFIIIKSLKQSEVGIIVSILLFVIGLTFVGHLLADTMPGSWRGFSTIKVYFFVKFFSLPGFLSKIWLYINSYLSVKALVKVTGITEGEYA